MKNLKGKTAVVTGAGMGMGLDLSRKLIQEGCSVALVDVRPESLQDAEQELRSLGPAGASSATSPTGRPSMIWPPGSKRTWSPRRSW